MYPWPTDRFDGKHPSWEPEPSALAVHARSCAGEPRTLTGGASSLSQPNHPRLHLSNPLQNPQQDRIPTPQWCGSNIDKVSSESGQAHCGSSSLKTFAIPAEDAVPPPGLFGGPRR